jgi:hypothetical protein
VTGTAVARRARRPSPLRRLGRSCWAMTTSPMSAAGPLPGRVARPGRPPRLRRGGRRARRRRQAEVSRRLQGAAAGLGPDDRVVVVSHAPPWGCLEWAVRFSPGRTPTPIGSRALRELRVRLVVCGHAHLMGGRAERPGHALVVNVASHDIPDPPSPLGPDGAGDPRWFWLPELDGEDLLRVWETGETRARRLAAAGPGGRRPGGRGPGAGGKGAAPGPLFRRPRPGAPFRKAASSGAAGLYRRRKRRDRSGSGFPAVGRMESWSGGWNRPRRCRSWGICWPCPQSAGFRGYRKAPAVAGLRRPRRG